MDQKTISKVPPKADYIDTPTENLDQEFFQSRTRGADLKSLDQANHNINLGMELLAVAERAYKEIESALTEIRQLATPSLASNFEASQRSILEVKISLKLRELDRLNDSSLFKEKRILDGSLSASREDDQHLYLMAGVNGSPENRINLNTGLNIPKISSKTLGLGTLFFNSPEESFRTMMVLENALGITTRLKQRSQTLKALLLKTRIVLDVSIANHQAAQSTPCSMDRAEEFLRATNTIHPQK